MSHWILLVAPLAIASFVLLFAFVGCGLNSQGTGFPPDDDEGRDYKSAVTKQTTIVSYWRLGEGDTGQPAEDSFGSNDGKYVGDVTLGQPGLLASDTDTAAQFDGATAQVELPNVVDVTKAFTIECWVRPAALNGAPTIVSQLDGTGTGRALLFVAVGGNFASNLGGTTHDSGFTAAADTTYYVVFTFAGGADGAWTFYVDGKQTASGTATGENADGEWRIGVNKLGAEFWNGTIDEVAVYNSALDAGEIGAHFSLGSTVMTP
jgi:hypothetical protein